MSSMWPWKGLHFSRLLLQLMFGVFTAVCILSPVLICLIPVLIRCIILVLFSLVTQSCLTLCNPVDCSTLGLPVQHQPPELAQTHVHRVGDAIQPSHPLSSPPSAFNLSQHQDLFKWVSSLHQLAKILEFQLQHQSFQWIFRVDFFLLGLTKST